VVRWGLLTTARINDAIIAAARASAVAEIAAVGSRDRERAERYARDRSIPRAHGSYEELLADPELDVVYVALPNALHVEWSIRALEAGKHVLCEKPMSIDPAEVERAFDVAARNERLLMEAFMYRHQPQVTRLRELVRAEAIGHPRLLRALFSYTLDDADDVRWTRTLGGGALLDLGTYCVNLMRVLAGEPRNVQANEIATADGTDLRFAGLLRFPNDVLGEFSCGFDLPRRLEFEVLGSEGTLRLSPAFGSDDGVLTLHAGDGEDEVVAVPPTSRYRLQVENFSRAVRGEEPPLLGREDAVGQARALAMLRAAAERSDPSTLA